MKNIDVNQLITADPAVCHGAPTLKGTRVMVWQILELLEDGKRPPEIYAAYPNLPKGAVETTLHYAAEKAKRVNYFPFTSKAPNENFIFAG